MKLQGWQIENIVTLIVMAAIIIGLYAMGEGVLSLLGLVLMLNLSRRA